MNKTATKWVLFLLLCVVWGSSFILMKLGMYGNGATVLLNAYQVAALRILSAGLVLLPVLYKAVKKIPPKAWGFVALSGLIGNFFPAFLFCIAETGIDSALTAMLNTLTPLCTLLAGVIVFKSVVSLWQWVGVLIGFTGCVLLFSGKSSSFSGELWYAMLVILATICYGLNVNLVRSKLTGIASLNIAAAAFSVFIIPSAIVLYATSFHKLPLSQPPYLVAIAATSLLGIAGTAIATIAFYKLVKTAGPVFSSMVTYGIPFVAICWGLLYHESVTGTQVLGLLVILTGVYLAGRQVSKPFMRPEKGT